MSLEKYKKKRKFEKTPEPSGDYSEESKNRFVIHRHQAKKAGLHHDLRLEMEGVLRSWAIPKGTPQKKGVKRLAIQTEDHPIDYIDFEGEIPEGQYGGGKVEIFDQGRYELVEKDSNKIIFTLKGNKIRGRYILVKLKDQENQWLIFTSD